MLVETESGYLTNLDNVIVLGSDFDNYAVNDTNVISALVGIGDKLNLKFMIVHDDLTMSNQAFQDKFIERFGIDISNVDVIPAKLGTTTRYNYLYATTDIRNAKRATLSISVGEQDSVADINALSKVLRDIMYSGKVSNYCNFSGCPNTGSQHKFAVRGPVSHINAVIKHLNGICNTTACIPPLEECIALGGVYSSSTLRIKCTMSAQSPLEI